MNVGRVSPSLALAAYAEAWISGAKVIVFGDALSPLPERLIERGARHVQVYDRDPARVAEATAAAQGKQISYAPLDQAGSTLRDGVFDFGIIEDLAAADAEPNLLLAPLGRALARRGIALIAARNPDVAERLITPAVSAEAPIGYYDFFDAVSQHFEEVHMLGQTPFVGYAIADFSASDTSDVRIDTALLPSGAEEPEWFLALASALPVTPDAFSVIQIPLADLELTGAPEPTDTKQREQSEGRIVELESALAKLTSQQARERSSEHERQLQALQTELKKREEWLIALEARAATADHRADEMQSELDQLNAASLKAKQQVIRLEQQVAEEQRSKKQLEKQLGEATRAPKPELDRLKQELDKSRPELDRLRQELDKSKPELDRLRQELDKSRPELDRLRQELDKSKPELDRLKRSADGEARRASELEAQARVLSQRVEQLGAGLKQSERQVREQSQALDEETRKELLEVEGLLKDRASEVTRLTAALHETERFGRQLIAEVTELKARGGVAGPPQDLDALARRNAQLEADLEAARWTISSLEANVGEEPTSPPAVAMKRRDEAARPLNVPGVD